MSDVPVGIYRDMPFAEYAAIDAINSGVVRWGCTTMLHMHTAKCGLIDSDDTKDRKLGRAIHCRLLEGEAYHERFTIAQPCCVLLKSGERKGAACGKSASYQSQRDKNIWACGTHREQIPDAVQPEDFIDSDEAEQVEKIAQKLHLHPAMKLFRRTGWSEVSMVWELCGLKCKCRIDKLDDWETTPKPLVIDIKSCQVGKATIEDCEKSVAENGYHRQAALNVNAVEALTGKRPGFVWVFVEKDEPFDVQILPADDETLAIGITEVRRTLELYRSAEAKGDYRGYIYDARFIRYGGLPGWYRQRYADDDGVQRSGTGAEIGAECAF